MSNQVNDISLDELIARDLLSVRTINICRDFDLTSAQKIIDFKEKHGHFRKLRGCGVNTETELNFVCKNFQDIVKESQSSTRASENLTEPNFSDEVLRLSPFKRIIFNRHFDYLLSRLSVRARNGILSLSKESNTRDILVKIFAKGFDFSSIRNIGGKTVSELVSFRQAIYQFFPNIDRTENDQLSKEYAALVIHTTYPELPINLNADFDKIFNESGKIKVFHLINLLSAKNILFKEKVKRVFEFSFTKGQEDVTFDSIAADFKISRERIRQIKLELDEEIENYFPFIANFSINDFVSYGIDDNSAAQLIDENFSEKINQSEETNFTPVFCGIVLRLLLKNPYTVFYLRKKIAEDKSLHPNNKYQGCYLISSSLWECFRFEDFVEDVYKHISSRITESYSLHLDGYLCQFLQADKRQLLSQLKPICEQILYNEFNLAVNPDGFIEFERNSKRPLSEYIVEVLESEDRMMKADEIMIAMNEKFPFLEMTELSVRATITRERDTFICFGRTSTYGLRKWEEEKANLKGGTIRDIVETFLQESDSPKHVTEILEHVLKYRDTNERSIVTSLKADTSNRFVFFDGYNLGLSNKTYGLDTLNYKRAVGSHFTPKMLKKFAGYTLDEIAKHYEKTYGYTQMQIRRILQNKIADGEIYLTEDDKLKI